METQQMNEVDLRSYPLPKHRSVFSALRNLGVSIGYDGWCLVVGTAHGAAGRRCEGTKDGDVVVDIVADPRMLERVTATLRSHGFEIADAVGGSGEWAGGNTARCTLVFGLAQIDVLCPDGTPDEMLDSVDGMRSIAIPGGTRALELSEVVDIFYDDETANAELRCPTLHRCPSREEPPSPTSGPAATLDTSRTSRFYCHSLKIQSTFPSRSPTQAAPP